MRKTTDGEIAYIWSREHGAVIGSHVHILLHLPAGYVWKGQRVQRWIERISDRRYRTGTIKTSRIGRTAKAHEQSPGLYLANLATVVGYVIKGTCPKAGAALQLGQNERKRNLQTARSLPTHFDVAAGRLVMMGYGVQFVNGL